MDPNDEVQILIRRYADGTIGVDDLGKEIDRIFGIALPEDDLQAIIESITRKFHVQPKTVPGWALLLRSPFDTSPPAHSWLGGLPRAPHTFIWPRDGNDVPLAFLAQIDLKSIIPEPKTRSRPEGLPTEGALLVFIGDRYICKMLTAEEVNNSVQIDPPDDLPSPQSFGFFGRDRTFQHWPVDLVPYLASNGMRPSEFPDPFQQPETWIVNWGIAALEAQLAIDCLRGDLSEGEEFEKRRRTLAQNGRPLASNPVIEKKTAHYAFLKTRAPEMIATLSAWHELTLSKPQEDPIELNALRKVFETRIGFSNAFVLNTSSKLALRGNPNGIRNYLSRNFPGLFKSGHTEAVPPAYQTFVELMVTDWRGHHLFGIEPDFDDPDEFGDMSGYECLISVRSDNLLGTGREHEYGSAIWCRRDQMARGQYANGRLLQPRRL